VTQFRYQFFVAEVFVSGSHDLLVSLLWSRHVDPILLSFIVIFVNGPFTALHCAVAIVGRHRQSKAAVSIALKLVSVTRCDLYGGFLFMITVALTSCYSPRCCGACCIPHCVHHCWYCNPWEEFLASCFTALVANIWSCLAALPTLLLFAVTALVICCYCLCVICSRSKFIAILIVWRVSFHDNCFLFYVHLPSFHRLL
jgi:hypothetical protein